MTGIRLPLRWILTAVAVSLACILLADDASVGLAKNFYAIGLVECLSELPPNQSDTSIGVGSPVYRAYQSKSTGQSRRWGNSINTYLRGVGLICAGELDEAQRTLMEGLEQGFRPQLSSLLVGDVLAIQGDALKAEDFWLRSGAGSVLLSRAQAALSDNDLEAAAVHLSVLWRISDSFESRSIRELANLYQRLGRHYFTRKAYSDAAAAYTATLQLAPSRHHARVSLAKIYRDQLEKPADAIEELEQVIEQGDKKWRAIAYGELGLTYFSMGKNKRAISLVQKSIDMDPKLATPHFYLGRILQQEGNLGPACKEYQVAHELDPGARGIENTYKRYCASEPNGSAVPNETVVYQTVTDILIN